MISIDNKSLEYLRNVLSKNKEEFIRIYLESIG